MGMMARAMTFHFFPWNGMTGCTLRLKAVRSYSPAPVFQLNCRGRVVMAARGF